MPDCNDRQYHAYAGPCHANRQECCQDHRFQVCDTCHNDTQVLLGLHPGGPNFVRVMHHADRYTPAPPLGPAGPLAPHGWLGLAGPVVPPPDPPFAGFMTRVCGDCERKLQSLRGLYTTQTVIPDHQSFMFAFPRESCTCAVTLGINGHGPRRCFPHRQKLWRKLEHRKNRNDRWLRNTERNAAGQIVQASDATKTLRRRTVTVAAPSGEATWRACRCGNTCDRTAFNTIAGGPRKQEVWLCMGCEGFLSRVNPTTPASHYNGILFTNPRQLRNRYRLGRVRSDGTQ